MNLYQIALPERTNDGARGYVEELERWEMKALILAGGYTYMGEREGAWRDSGTRTVYHETMHWYQVACEPERIQRLTEAALELFPDQLSIFVSQIGEAWVVERPRAAVEA